MMIYSVQLSEAISTHRQLEYTPLCLTDSQSDGPTQSSQHVLQAATREPLCQLDSHDGCRIANHSDKTVLQTRAKE
jgi:hypothetical protein